MEDEIKQTQDLIDKAVKNEHSKFEVITNFGMLSVARTYKSACKKLANSFRQTADKMYNDYIKLVNQEKDDSGHLLMEYRVMKQCEKFYKEEADIAELMIYDYVTYIHSGHLIDTLLGIERPGGEDNGENI